MSVWYDYSTEVDSRDIDGQGHCRPSAVLGILQEAATRAAEDRGFGREVLMERYGAFWVLARIWYRLDRPLLWEEELTVRTWHRGGRAASMYRDFDLYTGGAPVGEAVSVWALTSLSDRKLLRLSTVPELEGTDGGDLCKEITLSRLRMPADMVQAEVRPMRYSDTDMNGHVNNTRYADFVCDALECDRLLPDRFVSSLQIGYTAECRPGEVLTIFTGREGERQFVHGVDGAGRSRFDAAVFFGSTGQ